MLGPLHEPQSPAARADRRRPALLRRIDARSGPRPGNPRRRQPARGRRRRRRPHNPDRSGRAPELFTNTCGRSLESAESLRKEVKSDGAHVLARFNEMLLELDATAGSAELVANVHPDAKVREAAEQCERKLKELTTDIGLDRGLFDAVSGVTEDKLDDQAKRFRTKLLRDFRHAGVDKDEPTRNTLKEIQKELVKVGQEFSKAIRERHPKDPGAGRISRGLAGGFQEEPPAGQRRKGGADDQLSRLLPGADVRRQREGSKRSRDGFSHARASDQPDQPQEDSRASPPLRDHPRFQSWADYNAQDKMAGSADTIQKFTEQVAGLARPRMKKDLRVLLKRKKKDNRRRPRRSRFGTASTTSTKFETSSNGVDSKELRAYFEYDRVLSGMLALYGELFGLEFTKLPELAVWHESVAAYEMKADGKPLGIFYLDMHPRKDKYGHAAMFPMATGLAHSRVPPRGAGLQLPVTQ